MSRLIALLVLSLLGMQASMAKEPVGRLFSTPEQRYALDNLREAIKNQPKEVAQPEGKAVIKRKPVEMPETVSVQGYVKRSDGKKGTAWVNGKAVQERTGNKDVQVGRLSKNGLRVPIRLPANGKRLSLKAGQTYEPKANKLRLSPSYRIERTSGRIGDASTR